MKIISKTRLKRKAEIGSPCHAPLFKGKHGWFYYYSQCWIPNFEANTYPF